MQKIRNPLNYLNDNSYKAYSDATDTDADEDADSDSDADTDSDVDITKYHKR